MQEKRDKTLSCDQRETSSFALINSYMKSIRSTLYRTKYAPVTKRNCNYCK